MRNTDLALDFVNRYKKYRENRVPEELAVLAILCDIANEKDKMFLDLIEGLDSESEAKEIAGLCEDCLSKDCNRIACQGRGMYQGALEMAKWITDTLSEKSRSSLAGSEGQYMDNKTNKIKEWVKSLKAQANTIPSLGLNSLAGFMLACDDVIAFIDSLEKEPESNTVWHGKDEKPDFGTPILVIDCFGQPYSGYYNGINPRMVENWAYIKDLVNCKECHLEDKSETVSENLDEAATKWDETASFQPFYMQLDGNGNPCEVKQDITTHKESFKAGAEWQKQQDEKLFKEDSWNYIEENYPNITEEEKLRLYDISIKSRIAGANAVKQQMQETLQTEYEKGRFDMREEIEEGAVEFAKSYMEDVDPSFEKVQESEELWKWKMSCLRGINNAYKQGKQDALKNVPKWKKATEHLRGEGFIHYDNHSRMTAEYAYTNVEGGEYYLNIEDLKTLPKED